MAFLFVYFTNSMESLGCIHKRTQRPNKMEKVIVENMTEIIDNYNIIYETAKENGYFDELRTIGNSFL